jgi:hypothetical protein
MATCITIVNNVQQLPTIINPRSSGSFVNASLAVQSNVVSDVSTSPGIVSFPDAKNGFSLTFDDATVPRAYGGSVLTATKAMSTDIAVSIANNSQ